MWSILALGAVERLIHHVIDLDAITRIQLNQLTRQNVTCGDRLATAFCRCASLTMAKFAWSLPPTGHS